jgi:uncharacterized OB-fold protein
VTEPAVRAAEAYGDPLSRPFWEAAREHRLVVQRCRACQHSQFYARPFCLACEKNELDWVEVGGTGTVYSVVTVRVKVLPELEPPYQVAVVELDEGPRLTANIDGPEVPIGARVSVGWRDRDDLPPLPVFRPSA